MPRPVAVLMTVVATAYVALGRGAPAHAQIFGSPRPLGITHATVIDVEYGRRLRDHTVIIEGGRITAVGPSAQVRVPDGYGVIDARGKFVIPGFVDTRGTWAGSGTAPDSVTRLLERSLLLGVTTVREAGARDVDRRTARTRLTRDASSLLPRVVVADIGKSPTRAARQLEALQAPDGPSPRGDGIHDELRRLVERGVPPMEALRAVTVDAARSLERQRDVGIVAPGRFGDLIILDANPLDDIRNTTTINAILVGGRLIDSTERSRLLQRLTGR